MGEMSGGLERWSFGEFCGGFWDGSVVCGAENFEESGGLKMDGGWKVFGLSFWVLETREGRWRCWVFGCVTGEWNARVWRWKQVWLLGESSWVFFPRKEEGFWVEFSRSLSDSLNWQR